MQFLITLFAVAIGLLLTACEPAPEDTVNNEHVTTTSEYQARGLVAKTLPELSEALDKGAISAVELTTMYLNRIESIDRNGPELRSVIAINPLALEQASASDSRRQAGANLGPLDGLPILLKDNIESLDPMATTAGALALKDNLTGRDSPLVAGLRAAGAVILGKTNLSQWANFRSNSSISGWSALGGQVQNPHVLNRSPCGSSSGSGAAIAASLSAGAVGTETNGSIICPSNVNGIVGFKPTVGLVSAQHIVPISPSQDTAGPMTKTVRGAAMMLDAMADTEIKFSANLGKDSLGGKTIAVLRFDQGENADIVSAFNAALDTLLEAGATLVDVDSFDLADDSFWADQYRFLQYEFKASLNAYLSELPDGVTTRSLSDVIAFNQRYADRELVLFNQDIFEEADLLDDLNSEDYRALQTKLQQATREDGIDYLLNTFEADFLVAPSGPLTPPRDTVNGDIWPPWAGSGYLAAIAGYPHLTVPMGSVHGIPLGLSFIGSAGDDADILSAGYAFEQATPRRIAPKYLRSAEEHIELKAAIEGRVGGVKQ
ncbi:amidase family protein [Luminiphilus syltensis NOR5-1B]|uniref:Amidase family protein n=1 Tax=Luminiphilus syltensis NOR5-1B TaxID=565045 RepID=B8KWQ2_9GAMM|nr:amidase [Luminiphilus syltensis]EED34927.1 amidase family protein [Luminiphilus syltensis NOR5-1B]